METHIYAIMRNHDDGGYTVWTDMISIRSNYDEAKSWVDLANKKNTNKHCEFFVRKLTLDENLTIRKLLTF